MALRVVDTNVPAVAEGRAPQATAACRAKCVNRLARFTRDEDSLALDEGRLILGEYLRNLRSVGQPDAGHAFLKWVLTNWSNRARIVLVPITPRGGSFAEFPSDPALAAFHDDDRKFVAVARAHPDRPPILIAIDRGWWRHREALCRHGVLVDFLCPDAVPGVDSLAQSSPQGIPGQLADCVAGEGGAFEVQMRTGQRPARTHNLLFLAQQGRLALPASRADFLFELNRASVLTRYPENLDALQKQFDPARTRAIIDQTAEMLEWLRRQLGKQ